ncbi:zinc-binding dehydrogenase [Acidobacteriota bacterium]
MKKTMKAAFLTGIGRIEVRDTSPPKIQSEKDVLIRIRAVGLCGSDIHYFQHGRIGDQIIPFPFILGHECSGEVIRIGGDVKRISPGDHVAVDPAVSCGTCDQCRTGRPHTCRNLRFLGCPGQLGGGLCEYVVLPEKNCYPLPHSLTYEQGILAEPLSIGLYAFGLIQDLKSECIGILGMGPIGLSVMLAAQDAGNKRLFTTEKIEERLRAAGRAGALWTGNPDSIDVVQTLMDKGLEMDAVFECCGDPEALDQAVEILKPGGILLILGIPDQDRVSFDINRLRRKEIRIQNVRRQNGCIQIAVDKISKKEIDGDFMLTHRFPLESAQDAFDLVSGYRDGVIKAVITL